MSGSASLAAAAPPAPGLTPGFITAPLGSAGSGMNLDVLPSSVSERVNPLDLSEKLFRSIGNAQAEYGAVDDFGRQVIPPEPMVAAADLNQKYAVSGPTPALSWKADGPMPESVASSMADAARDRISRANAQTRSPGGIGNALADFGYAQLDPLNIVAAATPVFGEARMGALLARGGIDLGEGMLGRTAVRAASGAVDAATANLPLVGLRYGLSRQEGDDYSMYDAGRDVLYGAMFGSVLHPSLGAVGDAFQALRGSRGLQAVDANPDMRAASTQAGLAAVMEDRPVEVAPFADLATAQADNETAKAALRTELLRTAGEAQQLRGEAEGVPEGAPLDQATQDRIASVEDELTRPGGLTSDRQAELNAELDMLTLGQRAGDTDLETARSQAQRTGLLVAAQRAEQRVRDIQDQLLSSPMARQARGEPSPADADLQAQIDDAAKRGPVAEDAAPPEIGTQTAALREQLGVSEEKPDGEAPPTGKGTAESPMAGSNLDSESQRELTAIQEFENDSKGRVAAFSQAAACIAQGVI